MSSIVLVVTQTKHNVSSVLIIITTSCKIGIEGDFSTQNQMRQFGNYLSSVSFLQYKVSSTI